MSSALLREAALACLHSSVCHGDPHMNEEKSKDNGKEKELEEGRRGTMTSLLRNYISFFGLAIAAAALTSFTLLFMIEMFDPSPNPYTDLVVFIFVPGVMFAGLGIALIGALLERRRRLASDLDVQARYPVLDLNEPASRRSFILKLCVVIAFLFMSAFGSYRAYEYTESVAFCGQACHSVMKPEFVAYQSSPHARVACVECHVGEGPQGYVRAKFNGMRQLYGVATGHYDRPVKTPVLNMPATAQTCQKCHWSEKYNGDELRAFNHYAYDENNSLSQTRLLIKVGGGNPNAGPVGGIHWHMNVANEITYISTGEQRQNIPWVRMKDMAGRVVEFRSTDATVSPEEIERAEKRTMNCIDCHNRPAHVYLSPNEALDRAFDSGRLPVELPFLKAKASETLSRPYATNDEALGSIAAILEEYYRTQHPQVYSSRIQSIKTAIVEVQHIYQTYFFPEMKTNWEAHRNNIGHYNAQGCFRCHDGQHVSSDGQTIRNDCNICHTTLDQRFGAKTLIPTDGKFQHPVDLGDKNTWQCAACHRGDRAFVHPLNLGDISQFQCSECHKGQSLKMDLGRR